MLTQNSKYIYFFLVFIFLFLSGVSLSFSGETLTVNFIYLFTVLLLPIFDYIIDVIKKEFNPKVFAFDSLNIFKGMLFLVVASLLYTSWYEVATMLTLWFFLLFLLFDFWTKIPFFIALLLFLYSAAYIVSWDSGAADKLSIYAYYFLIIGVVLQVYYFYLLKIFPSEQK